MVSQVWSQEGTQEKFRKTKCVIITGPRDRKHTMPGRAMVRNSRFWSSGPRQGSGESRDGVFLGVSAGEARQDRVSSLGLAAVNNFERL